MYLLKIGLKYLGSVIPNSNIEVFKKEMKKSNLELITYDYEGQVQASLDEVRGVISIFLHAVLVSSFAQSIESNAAWDALKVVIKKIWLITRGKKYPKIGSRGAEKRDITFSIRVNLDTDSYYFKIDGLRDTEELNSAMDKILPYIEQQKAEQDNNKIFDATFDKDKEEWEVRDFLEDKRREKSRKN